MSAQEAPSASTSRPWTAAAPAAAGSTGTVASPVESDCPHSTAANGGEGDVPDEKAVIDAQLKALSNCKTMAEALYVASVVGFGQDIDSGDGMTQEELEDERAAVAKIMARDRQRNAAAYHAADIFAGVCRGCDF